MIIIPDIHGRDFWKKAMSMEDNEYVFLGDYTDPYTDEGIPSWRGMESLMEVLEFKDSNPDKVTLLLGNHDLAYLDDRMLACRHDYENEYEIRQLLEDNLSKFNIVHTKMVGDKLHIFSHAGILQGWLNDNLATLPPMTVREAAEQLNPLFHEGKLYPALADVSHHRGGVNKCGSVVWADVEEHFEHLDVAEKDIPDDIFQVFGHSAMYGPFTTDHFACLDCQRVFKI